MPLADAAEFDRCTDDQRANTRPRISKVERKKLVLAFMLNFILRISSGNGQTEIYFPYGNCRGNSSNAHDLVVNAMRVML